MAADEDVSSVLLVRDEGAVRLLTLNRPDVRNAFDAALYLALSGALQDARADDAVNVVVLTGAGHVFSSGQDLDEMAALAGGTAPEGAERGFPTLLDTVQAFDKPLIAAVNGPGVGLGFTLLAHCDLVLVADTARFKVPFAELGVAPEAASSYLFPLRLGPQVAANVLLGSAWLSAEEAVATGFALRSCPADAVVDEALELATGMAAAPLVSLRTIKSLLLQAHVPEVEAARAREEAAFAELLFSATTKDALDRATK
jgi:enoyl-CoA hydratase/carnithine racemase